MILTVVKTSETAHRELLDMLAWIARDSPRNALEFIDALRDEMHKVLETLPLFPVF